MKYCIGVDLGGTTVKMGIFTSEGELLDKWEIVTRTENEGELILPDIAQALKSKLMEHHADMNEVLGIGMGIPAPVTEDGFIKETANVGWKNKEVKKELERLTGVPVWTTNDANMAALGEMWAGAGKGNENVVMITLGTGVGSGIISNGEPIAGAHGAAGEIGHSTVNYEEQERCGCGRFGCLEQYVSATGIARMARKKLQETQRESMMREETYMTSKVVFDAVKAGDDLAREVADDFGKCLGRALANVALVCDPYVFVIGGGVSKAGTVLLDYVVPYYKKYAFFANKDVIFTLAELGNDAGIYGGAKLVLNHLK